MTYYNNSRLAAFRRCPQKFVYAYIDRLTSPKPALPLYRGSWVHTILEVDALERGLEKDSLLQVPSHVTLPNNDKLTVDTEGRRLIYPGHSTYPLDGNGAIEVLTDIWGTLFHEEQAHWTDKDGKSLPEACQMIYDGYLDYYAETLHHEQPLLLEVTWVRDYEGNMRQGRVDQVLVDHRGRIVVRDHKTTGRAFDPLFKLTNTQLHLYAWGITPLLAGHNLAPQVLEYDVLSTKLPSEPKTNKDGSMSKRKIVTSTRIMRKVLIDAGHNPDDEQFADLYESWVKDDDFYQRHTMPVQPTVTKRLLDEDHATITAMGHVELDPDRAWRAIDRSCEWCEFAQLCTQELYDMDASATRSQFAVRDA